MASSVALSVNCVQSNMDGPGCTLRSHRPGKRIVLRGPRPPPAPLARHGFPRVSRAGSPAGRVHARALWGERLGLPQPCRSLM